MSTRKQLTQWCVDNYHPVQAVSNLKHFSGVSTLTELILGGGVAVAAFALGWYIKGRGMTGVQIDLNNVKTDVENLKSKVLPTVGAATPVA